MWKKSGDLYVDWNRSNGTNAQQILIRMTSFTFIIVFTMLYQYVAHLTGITVKLQWKAFNIVEVHEMTVIITVYKNEH